MIWTVGYYRVASGVSSVCVSSQGAICERVCLVMSFLKGVGEEEPSPGPSPLPLCMGRQGRALWGHFDVFNRGMQAGVRRLQRRDGLWLCAPIVALNGAGSPWPEGLRGVAGMVGARRRDGALGQGWWACRVKAPAAATPRGAAGRCGRWVQSGRDAGCNMPGGHPHAWVLGPARGGSPPTGGLGVLPQNSFSHVKTIWQIEPKFGLA